MESRGWWGRRGAQSYTVQLNNLTLDEGGRTYGKTAEASFPLSGAPNTTVPEGQDNAICSPAVFRTYSEALPGTLKDGQ